MDGWLNIFKPRGVSSAFLLSKVKRIINKKIKIGHCGTLDPQAEGILPIAVGQATRLTRFVSSMNKIYEFTIQFGSATDTADIEGKIMEISNNFPTKNQCADILDSMIGEQYQKPHKFSAVKIDGVRAYSLARKGVEFDTKEKLINIFSLDLLNFDDKLGRASFRVECSPGTYVRTIAEKIAFSLKSLGFVISLVRTDVGKTFSYKNLVLLKDLLSLDDIKDSLISPGAVLNNDNKIEVPENAVDKIKHGQKIYVSIKNANLVWASYLGYPLAIGEVDNNRFSPRKVFNFSK